MPQLNKRGKWVFGWVMVGSSREIQIPPEAYHEYGFLPGEMVSFTRGSRISGGFGLGRHAVLLKNERIQTRILTHARLEENRLVFLPPIVDAQPGDRLMVVRGSNLALGFLKCGPIVEEAQRHPEIEVFTA